MPIEKEKKLEKGGPKGKQILDRGKGIPDIRNETILKKEKIISEANMKLIRKAIAEVLFCDGPTIPQDKFLDLIHAGKVDPECFSREVGIILEGAKTSSKLKVFGALIEALGEIGHRSALPVLKKERRSLQKARTDNKLHKSYLISVAEAKIMKKSSE